MDKSGVTDRDKGKTPSAWSGIRDASSPGKLSPRSSKPGAKLFKDLTEWFIHYKEEQKHSSLDNQTPDKAYFQGLEELKQTARIHKLNNIGALLISLIRLSH